MGKKTAWDNHRLLHSRINLELIFTDEPNLQVGRGLDRQEDEPVGWGIHKVYTPVVRVLSEWILNMSQNVSLTLKNHQRNHESVFFKIMFKWCEISKHIFFCANPEHRMGCVNAKCILRLSLFWTLSLKTILLSPTLAILMATLNNGDLDSYFWTCALLKDWIHRHSSSPTPSLPSLLAVTEKVIHFLFKIISFIPFRSPCMTIIVKMPLISKGWARIPTGVINVKCSSKWLCFPAVFSTCCLLWLPSSGWVHLLEMSIQNSSFSTLRGTWTLFSS